MSYFNFFKSAILVSSVWLNVDVFTAFFTCCEDYYTINKSEQCVVFTHTDVVSWVEFSTSLTYDDVTSFASCTTEYFYA